VNVVDTIGFTFKEYLYGTFRQQIVDEFNAYLNTVDFLKVIVSKKNIKHALTG